MHTTGPADASSTGTVGPTVERCLTHVWQLWWGAGDRQPDLSTPYSRREQQANAGHLDRLVDQVVSAAETLPRSVEEQDALQQRILQMVAAFARSALRLGEPQLGTLFGEGFAEAAVTFAQRARAMDPAIPAQSIFQAWRNAWTMNGIQLLCGQRVRLTPSVFAYSMLYPYTDNYLDDPAVAPEAKRAFSAYLSRRLAGESVSPDTPLQARVAELVGLIESEYSRSDYPQVYESLLAIHDAQIASLELLSPGAAPYVIDVLGLALRKGGVSVLADGYLVAGTLGEAQARALFGYGALLQLVDDLQDVAEDRACGLQTIYAQTAGHWPLDALTLRTLRFGRSACADLEAFDAPQGQALRELMALSVPLLVVGAVGRARRWFTRRFVDELEPFAPLRFGASERRRHRMRQHLPAVIGLLDTYAQGGASK